MSVALISHPDCLRHDMGPVHPESAARLWAINDQLIASRLEAVLRHYDAPLVTREQLQRVHDPAYVEMVFQTAPVHGLVALEPETLLGPHSLAAAQRAAGAVVHGVDLVMRGEVTSAFCNVRPPGHHAERQRAMGGCIFNNVAIGAAHAMAAHNIERVAILDFDVHHGNGTEDIFRNESRVLFCSTFQHPYYPFSGLAPAGDHFINVPLAAGTDGTQFRAAIEQRWLPALSAFRPEIILVSAGFDGHYLDDIGQLQLDETDYAWVTKQITAIAAQHAQGCIVSVLEGGYNPRALGRSVVAHIQALMQT
jgi:acetoin utilization deacetylase AcuC-like enzyme